VALIDKAVFSTAIFLLILGLILEASGFGIFVTGRLDGLLLVVIGISMFWGGWIMSGARGFSCATAAALNIFDAASTVSFWNFEINPIARTAGPTAFMMAKILCSIAIVLYAKLHGDPREGGLVLSAFLALIVGWNLGQHLLAYLGLRHFAYGVLFGTVFSFVASAVVLLMLFISENRKLCDL
jgi:hypothetical protein